MTKRISGILGGTEKSIDKRFYSMRRAVLVQGFVEPGVK